MDLIKTLNVELSVDELCRIYVEVISPLLFGQTTINKDLFNQYSYNGYIQTSFYKPDQNTPLLKILRNQSFYEYGVISIQDEIHLPDNSYIQTNMEFVIKEQRLDFIAKPENPLAIKTLIAEVEAYRKTRGSRIYFVNRTIFVSDGKSWINQSPIALDRKKFSLDKKTI